MHSARHRVQNPDAPHDGATAPLTPTALAAGIPQFGTARNTWEMDRQAAATLPGTPSSVAMARRFVRITAAMWQLPRGTLADAELCMSELVCNAVTHTGSSRVHCRLWSARGVLFLEVDDEDLGELPEVGQAEADDEHGRGMLLIDSFATAWGAVPRPGTEGKTVWAALNLADG
ncbi:ATP-binding protein [Streptacidiphilus carbonis]|uniref:ATP-binding protein n=1 Tax=Streptacidiphilus carbonis TaxID=105422 RepID=UPI000694D20A|nr:ATP-binding protein [Streptacidiphilus carbonis]